MTTPTMETQRVCVSDSESVI